MSTIQHSSLPTLIAEGKNDLIVLRRLEDTFAHVGLSVLPAGGRERVLRIYIRKDEISNKKLLLFLADLDTWIHAGIPSQYSNSSICFTDGYSIENDLYRDGDLERLLDARERMVFSRELDRFLHWYALALSRHLNDRSKEIAVHPNALFVSDEHYASVCQLNPGEAYPDELLVDLKTQYRQLVRGKSLLALLLRQLSTSSRTSKFSSAALLEIGATSGGRHVIQITNWLEARLQ